MSRPRHTAFVRPKDDLGAVRQHIEEMLKQGLSGEALDLLFDLLLRVRDDNDLLRVRLATALRRLYGRSSEKLSQAELQGILRGILDDAAPAPTAPAASPAQDPPDAAAASSAPPPADDKPAARSKPLPPGAAHGRSKMPTHLPCKSEPRALSDAERRCPCCAGAVEVIGTEPVWSLDFEPGSLFVRLFVCEKGACPRCPEAGVVTAAAPAKPIAGGAPGAGLLARMLVEKAEDHLPLHRQQKRFAREGLVIPETTLQGWWRTATLRLAPLRGLLRTAVLSQSVVQLDGTGLPVLDKDHEKGLRRGTVWTVVAVGVGVVFTFEPVRRDGLAGLLHEAHALRVPDGATPAAVSGPIRFVVDGELAIASALDAVALGPAQNCQMHARRGFEKTLQVGDARAAIALDLFAQLYDVESAATAAGATASERLALRQARSVPILEALRAWLVATLPTVGPRTPLGKALRYVAQRWMSLTLFVLDGTLPLDTGEVERQIRRIALGRRNYLFVGSDQGARDLCVITSLCGTCRMLGIEPWSYLRDVLTQLAEGVPADRLPELLPAAWAQKQAERAQHAKATPTP